MCRDSRFRFRGLGFRGLQFRGLGFLLKGFWGSASVFIFIVVFHAFLQLVLRDCVFCSALLAAACRTVGLLQEHRGLKKRRTLKPVSFYPRTQDSSKIWDPEGLTKQRAQRKARSRRNLLEEGSQTQDQAHLLPCDEEGLGGISFVV